MHIASVAWGALKGTGRVNAGRARRLLRPRSYWRAMSARFPLSGSPLVPFEETIRVARATGFEDHREPLLALPGLEIIAGRAFYDAQDIGRVPRPISEAWSRFHKGGRAPEDVEALVREGLLVEVDRIVERPRSWSLVVVPHKDDGSLAIGGVIALRAPEEAAFVLSIFTISGWLGEGFRARALDHVTQLREREERLAARVIGAKSASLGLWEIDIRNFHRRAVDGYRVRENFRFDYDRDLRTSEERDAISCGISAAVRALEPVRIYLPLAVGGHADHVELRETVLAVLPVLARSAPGARFCFYEDQPYATYPASDLEAVVRRLRSRGFVLTPEVIDVTPVFERKIQSIAVHRSQYSRRENEERLRAYAGAVAAAAPDLGAGRLAERLWGLDGWRLGASTQRPGSRHRAASRPPGGASHEHAIGHADCMRRRP